MIVPVVAQFFVRDAVWARSPAPAVQGGGRFGFAALARHLGVLVLVFGVARRAARLLARRAPTIATTA